MKESSKRIIDWLALIVLSLPAAFLWFDYTDNTHPSNIWIVLLMLDIPLAVAAVIWLWGRFLSPLLREERAKRVVDRLALIPIGVLLSMAFWGQHPSVFLRALALINVPLAFASIVWLILRKAK